MFTVAVEKLIGSQITIWLRKAARKLAVWYRRARTRNDLGHLLRLGFVGHRELRDMGVSRAEVAYEADKPFWQV